MTTEYKLLLQDECTFVPLEKKENEDVLRFEITIPNPKTLMAYEVWNQDTPKANAGTSKLFSIAPTVLYNCVNNYNEKVKRVDGFTYKPTAIVVLGNITHESKNEGGVLVIDTINGGWSKDTNEPFMIMTAHSRHSPELAEIAPFPTETFTGKIRMNINGLQSTALLGVVDNEFIEGWLKPTYDKLEPYPYVGEECVENPEKTLSNRVVPTANFAYGGNVSIKNVSSGVSRITITNPRQTVQYQIWNPLTPYNNEMDIHDASVIPLSSVYSIFSESKKQVIDKGLQVNEYAWRPVATFDLIDENGKGVTYIGRIVNMESELGEPNEAPKIMIDVDTRNFELYKNKKLPTLPEGDFLMLMDIDGTIYPERWLQAPGIEVKVGIRYRPVPGALEIDKDITLKYINVLSVGEFNKLDNRITNNTLVTFEVVKNPYNIDLSIDKLGFSGCNRLAYFTIPEGVTSIGYRAFYYCEQLVSIVIPGSVTNISERAFGEANDLTEVTFKKSEATRLKIGDNAWYMTNLWGGGDGAPDIVPDADTVQAARTKKDVTYKGCCIGE